MEGRSPLVGLNIAPVGSFPAAAGPLFDAGLVDAIEWDLDESFGWRERAPAVPPWVDAILDVYSEDDALYGHGVWFSLLSARWEKRQEVWLENLARECRRRRYRHLSEHLGFMTAGGLWRGPLLPMPYTPSVVRLGRDRLQRLAAAAQVPVGLESLAQALGRADAEEQGALLDDLLAPLDGFVILDVHNLWTQARNLGLDALALLETYPLGRVRELHIAGGQWYAPKTQPERGPFRLDSHDGPVPDEAFALLQPVLRRCSNVEVVIFENRGVSIDTPDEQARYRDDFMRVRALVESCNG